VNDAFRPALGFSGSSKLNTGAPTPSTWQSAVQHTDLPVTGLKQACVDALQAGGLPQNCTAEPRTKAFVQPLGKHI
jgi:hypothetical protein